MARLRRSLNDRLTNEARRRGVAADQLRKQYIFTIFLSRIFQHDPPWVLLGGNALLIRTGGGRFTQDIDLARDSGWGDLPGVLDELRTLSSVPFRQDPFEFVLHTIEPHQQADPYGYAAETAKVKARSMLGGQVFENFTIDLTTRRHVDWPVDHVPLRPVINHDTLQHLPAVPTTPVENHLCDKICAMYEKHGPRQDQASTRYRDLADIVRIVLDLPFDAGRLSVTLGREAARRRLVLPARLEAPDPAWQTTFPAAAANFAEYPRKYWPLDDALLFAGACLNQVLNGDRVTGTWEPLHGHWAN